MKIDKYYGSLRSRDNQWGVDLSLSRNQVIITTNIYIFLSLYSQILESLLTLEWYQNYNSIIDSRPDRHFLNWFPTSPVL